MRVMNQGASYDEDTTGAVTEDESEEETSAGVTKIAGIPIKVLILGGVVLLLIILVVIVLGTRKSGGDTVIPATDPNLSVTDQTVQQGSVPAAAPVSTTTYYWYTQDGAYIGSSTAMLDGTMVTDNGIEMAVLSTTGTTQLMTDTGLTYMANMSAGSAASTDTGTSVTILNTGTGQFTEEQVQTLKKLGYTGDEISVAMRDYLDYDALVAAAQALREQEAIDELVRMSDHESEEFQYLLNYSIFHFPYREFTPRNGENIAYNQPGSYVVNADYEKLDTYGLQLILKVKIANDTYVYMTVEPSRWETLPDTGNIVVRVEYIRYGLEEANDVYITNIVEQDITTITVNPEDSTVNFDELTASPTQ